ncbi:dTDP-glucose 4,6-dehydratase [bacterium]|nr:dTDP-glucose 4,6-dehydratase [bacterium]
MSKILVTGGAGFIGSEFVRYWLAHHPEDEITNLDALTYAGNLANLVSVESNPRYHFVKGDICDRQIVNELMKNTDIVVHFAAESHVDRSILEPEAFLQTNVLGTFNLVQAAVENKIKHFHHVSTDEVFGSLELGSAEKFTLETPYEPRSPYSASKASSDHLVRAYGETYGLPYTITNCSNNYGSHQFPEKLFGLTITNLIEGKKVPIYGDGKNVRDWLFVTDHVRGIEAVLQHGPTQETFLLGGLTKDVSNYEVISQIIRLMGKNPDEEIEFVRDRAGHDRRYAIDWSGTQAKLGWQPSVTLEEGLRQTIDWYVENEDWWRPLKEQAAGFFAQNYRKRA